MGIDDKSFEEQLEKELENFMGRPLPEVDEQNHMEQASDYEDEETLQRRRKRKRIKIAVLAVVVVLLLGTLGVYGGYAYYYSDKFYQGTYINQADCSGLTVPQAEELIRKQVENYQLEVNFQNDETQTIKGTDIDYEYVPDGTVSKLKKSQNPLLWVKGLFGKKEEYKIKANIKYSEEKLEETAAAMAQMQDANMVDPQDAKVEFVDTKFQVTREVNGSKLDKNMVLEGIVKAISDGERTLNVEEMGAYIRPQKIQTDEALVSQAAQLNELTASSITYQLPSGEQVLDGSTLKDWLSVDENGNYSKDEAVWNQHITEYVAAMAQAVNTYNVDTKFNATNLGEITIKGKYGFEINQQAEIAQLTEELANHTVTTRKPNYSHEALTYDNNGFGNSYVEIDLSRQHVWMYKDGELIVDTGCVSGMMTADRWTPPGIFTLTYKKTPSTLRGPKKADGTYEWESDVTYWMPFNGGIGLHDATWRGASEFGTNRYKNNGSHGCINLPLSKAKVIYENIDKNMPIICYYSEPYKVGASTKKAEEKKTTTPKPTGENTKTPTKTPTKAPTKEPTATPTEKPVDTPEPADTPDPTPDTPSEPSDNGGQE